MSEHQKLQEKRKEDYETIKVHYTHLRQVIVNDETLEQTKKALKKFKTNKKLKAAGLRFNPTLQRWLTVAEGRIARWERDHPELETEPDSGPEHETEPESDPEKETEKEPEPKSEETPESEPKGDTTSADADEETDDTTVEPETEEKPEEEPKPQ